VIEKLEKIAALNNEVQAQLLEAVLRDREIPHVIQSHFSHAYDGLFQMSSGWGHVEAPAQFKQEILSILQDMEKEESADESRHDEPSARLRWYQRAIVIGLLGLLGIGVIVSIMGSAQFAYLREGMVIFLILAAVAWFVCRKYRGWVIAGLAVLTIVGVAAVVPLSINYLTLVNDTEHTIERVNVIVHQYDFPLTVGPFAPGRNYTLRFSASRFDGCVTVFGQFDEENGFYGRTKPEAFHGRLTVRIRSDGSIAAESR